MKNPCARHNDICCENLDAETILYDKANDRAHSLNRTVMLVWESADGQRSVEEIAAILHSELGIPADRSVVLLALQELAGAGLLQDPEPGEAGPELLTRREVARKLALTGAGVAMLPVIATVLAPTPAMASSMISQPQAEKDLIDVGLEAAFDPNFGGNPTARQDLTNAAQDFGTGNYNAEIQQLDGVIQALGLPPL